jgi:hypothetical protein
MLAPDDEMTAPFMADCLAAALAPLSMIGARTAGAQSRSAPTEAGKCPWVNVGRRTKERRRRVIRADGLRKSGEEIDSRKATRTALCDAPALQPETRISIRHALFSRSVDPFSFGCGIRSTTTVFQFDRFRLADIDDLASHFIPARHQAYENGRRFGTSSASIFCNPCFGRSSEVRRPGQEINPCPVRCFVASSRRACFGKSVSLRRWIASPEVGEPIVNVLKLNSRTTKLQRRDLVIQFSQKDTTDTMTLLIEDCALINDCKSATLFGRNSSVDWLGWPRLDSPACCAVLLGSAENGRWFLAPRDQPLKTRRSYRRGTSVPDTEFATLIGRAVVADFMPLSDSTHLVRIVTGTSGHVALRTELAIRFNYGTAVPWVKRPNDGSIEAISGPERLVPRTPEALYREDLTTVGEPTIEAGQSIPFVLSYRTSFQRYPSKIDPVEVLAT